METLGALLHAQSSGKQYPGGLDAWLHCTITRRQVAIVVLLETADGAAYVCFLDIILSSVLI